MNEHNENTVEEAVEVEVEVEVRTLDMVLAELKREGSKLSRQEAKAVESDKLADAFNGEIMEMAQGNKQQTPTRNIATIAQEQAKHIKRAAKFRENNSATVAKTRELQAEANQIINSLLTPYEVEADEVAGEEEAA